MNIFFYKTYAMAFQSVDMCHERLLEQSSADLCVIKSILDKTKVTHDAGNEWFDISQMSRYTCDKEQAIIKMSLDGQFHIGNAKKYRIFPWQDIVLYFKCALADFRPYIVDDHVRYGEISMPLNCYRNPALYLCSVFASGGGWYLAESPIYSNRYKVKNLSLDSIEDLQCALKTTSLDDLIAHATFDGDQIHIGDRTFTSGGTVRGEVARMIAENAALKAKIDAVLRAALGIKSK